MLFSQPDDSKKQPGSGWLRLTVLGMKVGYIFLWVQLDALGMNIHE